MRFVKIMHKFIDKTGEKELKEGINTNYISKDKIVGISVSFDFMHHGYFGYVVHLTTVIDDKFIIYSAKTRESAENVANIVIERLSYDKDVIDLTDLDNLYN